MNSSLTEETICISCNKKHILQKKKKKKKCCLLECLSLIWLNIYALLAGKGCDIYIYIYIYSQGGIFHLC